MKKQIIAVAAAAMICVGAIGGTFAYLTSGPATVTNTFTVGSGVIFVEPDENLAGGLDEAKVNDLGEEVQGAKRVTENIYKLIPGHTYTKDPTVHIAPASDACYVFIHVENGISGIEASGATTIKNQIEQNWTAVDGKEGYYYWKNGVLAADAENKNLVVFNNFTVDGSKAQADLKTLTDAGAKIQIKACAVQADGFNSAADAVTAWPSDF